MKIPRVMLAAPSSGSGKTLITCGILQALVNRGMDVSSFKCGPDYIDPMFHERVIGTKSRNLDLFFTRTEITKYLFGSIAVDSDISVVEGVMGFYDGIDGGSSDAGSYDLSSKLDIPVILVVDCSGASLSVVATVKGFKEFRKNNIKGVILNNMNEKLYCSMKHIIEEETGLKVIGHVPTVKELIIESRHLGLLMPSEIDGLKEKLNDLAAMLEKTLSIDSIIEMAGSAPDFFYNEPELNYERVRARVGVAFDECFCFLYKDNIEMLERMGAEIAYFSPLRGNTLPKGIDGMIIPGGYPELYADVLTRDRSLMREIKENIADGMPCMAECGGFMYLHDELEDDSGTFHKMTGVINAKTYRRKKLSRFGYITVTAKKDGLLSKNTEIRGHEFHYWDSTDCGYDCEAVKPSGGEYKCMHIWDNLAAGFPHLYYYSNPDVPYRFLRKCKEYRDGKLTPSDLNDAE